MNIAVLADIHANPAALHAVIEDVESWSPDLVIVAGDIIGRGPLSHVCLELVLRMRDERGWRVIRGNHERYVLHYEQERQRPDFPTSGPQFEVSRVVAWTHGQVAEMLPQITALPEHLILDLDGERLAIYHASVRHDRDGIYRGAPLDEVRTQIDPAAAVFCAGHTHTPLVRQVDSTLVVNTGSVGLPFDGDPRAAYARLTRGSRGWQASIRRVRYDIGMTERAFAESGMLEVVGAYAHLMLRELRTGQSYLFDFIPAYHHRILSGAISLEEAIRDFLTRVERAA
ncbi:MAG: metallophosphoesterase family protein [Chloroflexaceae bacterium]